MKAVGAIAGTGLIQWPIRGLAVWLMTAVLGLSGAEPGESWIVRNPIPTSNSVRDIIYGKGLWVAVGAGGTILVSRDLKVWIQRPTETTEMLLGVAGGERGFVAVGRDGTILFSEEGEHWRTTHRMDSPRSLHSVAYGANRFVVGGWGRLATSDDGVNWSIHEIGGPIPVRPVAFVDGTFIALAGYVTLRSADGLSWSSTPLSPGGSMLDIAYGNGVYLLSGIRRC